MRAQFHGRTHQQRRVKPLLRLISVFLFFIGFALVPVLAHAGGTIGDSDGDSIPDITDLDDDNDSIPDTEEGTGDIDNDGIANCLDLDSDNDGLPDLIESITNAGLLRLLDANGDGLLDSSVVVGANGLADLIEESPESGTTQTGRADLDGDGLVDHQDLDVDNDGIPDVIEAGSSDSDLNGRYDFFLDLNGDGLADRLSSSPIIARDTDRDGVPDYRDIDSDQDGLSDRLETTGVDTDSDGRVDNFSDLNVDGLDDGYYARAAFYPDTDQDGFPDYRDTDSDGDGVTDSEEATGTPVVSQPIVPTTPFNPGPNQSAQMKNITLETGESGSVFGCALASDVNAARQAIDPLFLLLLIASLFVLFRSYSYAFFRSQSKLFWLLLVGLLSACASPPRTSAPTLAKDINQIGAYAGLGFGASFLNANTTNLPLTQDQSLSGAGQVTIGVAVGQRFALEARAADLGEATFTNGRAVGYQVADLSALYKQRFGKFAGFGRLGAGALFNDGDIPTTQKNPTHFLVGAGIDYALTPRVALRTEWQGHDADVMHAQFSVLYRFGAPASRRPIVVAKNTSEADSGDVFKEVPVKPKEPIAALEPIPAPKPVPQPVPKIVPKPEPKPVPLAKKEAPLPVAPPQAASDTPAELAIDKLPVAKTSPLPADQKNLAALEIEKAPSEPVALATPPADTGRLKPLVTVPEKKKIVPKPVDLDKDGIVDASDSCPGTKAGVPVLPDGCSIFGESVSGLSFFPDTDRLTSSAKAVLDTVADALNEESDIRVTVAAHTAPSEDANAAMFLTRRRTIAIIRYLSDKGIDTTRLRPEAFGDTQPLADAKELSENDRVVLSPAK